MDEITPKFNMSFETIGRAAPRHPNVLRADWRANAQRFLLGFSVVVLVAIVAWPLLPRRYESYATIVMRPTDEEGRADRAPALRQSLDESAIQSEVDIIGSPGVAATVIDRHRLIDDPEFNRRIGGVSGRLRQWASVVVPSLAGPSRNSDQIRAELRQKLQQHLNVSRDRRSYTVKLGYWSSDPAKAVALTSTLLSAYVDDQLARKRQSIDSMTRWLNERVAILRSKYDASSRTVSQFMVQSNLIDSGEQIALDQQLTSLGTEAAQVRARAIEAKTRAQALTQLQKAGLLEQSPEVLSSPTVQRLKESLAATFAKPVVLARDLQAINAEITLEASRIWQAAEAEAQNLAQRDVLLQQEIQSLRSVVSQRRQAEIKLEELRREASIDKTVLDDALTRLRDQTARADALRPDIEVLAQPEMPLRATFPDPLLTALGTLLLATLAGLTMIWRPVITALSGLLRGRA
ncbi:GumC family protein [Microvirga flavescens]|uniref:GumC family protein n=1 Tax=Microvirga flavescens TaxID=2249811 RepID=UPI000DD667AD|nr:GumC family protein [Microvirga flavescens]